MWSFIPSLSLSTIYKSRKYLARWDFVVMTVRSITDHLLVTFFPNEAKAGVF